MAVRSHAVVSHTGAMLVVGLLASMACGGSRPPATADPDGPRNEAGGVQVGSVSPSRAGANKPAERAPEYEPLFFTRRVAEEPAAAPEQARHETPVPVAMERFDSPACEGIPPRSRAACPLLAGIAEVEKAGQAFIVRFESWVDVDKAVELMRCHHAFGEARGWQQMPFCPLYIPGLQMETVDESTVSFTVEGEENLRELERRLRAHSEGPES